MKVTWGGSTLDAVQVQRMTVGEVVDIERHFGCGVEELSGTMAALATIYVTVRRQHRKVTWDVFERLTLEELEELLVVDETGEVGEGGDPPLGAGGSGT